MSILQVLSPVSPPVMFQGTIYNQRLCAFGSSHPNGANFALGDGSTRFITQTLSQSDLTRLCVRNDGQSVLAD